MYLCFFSIEVGLCPKKTDFDVVGVGPNVAISSETWKTAKEWKKQDDSVASEHFQSLEPEEDRCWFSMQGYTNSEFAEFLLHSLVQCEQFEQESVRMDDGEEG